MPPRDPNLPEGTDSIVDDMSEFTGGTSGAGTGGMGSGGTSGMGLGGSGGSLDRDDMGGGLGGGFSGGLDSSFDASGSQSTMGTGSLGGGSTGSSSMGASSTGGASRAASDVANSSGIQSLKAQAGDKVRDVASQGKERATEALTNVTQLINETAQTVEERLGPQYGDYVRRAASAIEGFGTSIQNKEVDELFDDARNFVRSSPGAALGAAAAIGFLLVRVVKSGLPADTSTDSYRSAGDFGTVGGSTQQLASPPRVDNSYDPIA